MILLEEADILRVFYCAEEGLQIHEWFNYNPEDRDPLILDLLERIYNLLLEYPVEKLLVRTKGARGAFSPQVQTFIREVQFPRFCQDTNIRFVATVSSAELFERIGTELWRSQVTAQYPIIVRDVDSEAEAREWLQRMSASPTEGNSGESDKSNQLS